MLPYTIIKEANPPQFGGTATGVVNFLNFTFSALLGPVFGRILLRVSGGAAHLELAHYQAAFCRALRRGYRDRPALLLKRLDRRRARSQEQPRRFRNEASNSNRNWKIRTAFGTVSEFRAGAHRSCLSM